MRAERGKVKFVLLLLYIFLLSFIIGCSRDVSGNYGYVHSPSKEEIIEAVPSSNVKELDQSTQEQIEYYDGNTIIFSQKTATIESLSPGDIIISQPTDSAPYGILRKVSSIQKQNGKVIIQLQKATLEEAFDKLRIKKRISITADKIKSSGVAGVYLKPLSTSISLDLTRVIYDVDKDISTTYDQVKIIGNLTFDLDADINIDLDKALGKATVEIVFRFRQINSTLGIQAGSGIVPQELAKELELPIGELKVIIPSSPPVVLTFELNLILGVQTTIKSDIYLAVKPFGNADIGFYAEGRVTGSVYSRPIKGFSLDASIDQGSSINVNAKAYAKPKLKVKVYDIIGPYTGIEAFTEAITDILLSQLQIYAGIDAEIGGTLEVFGYNLADISYSFELWRKLLWEINLVNNPPVVNFINYNCVSGSAGTSPPSYLQEVSFNWDVYDPDGDRLTCYLDVDNDGVNDYVISDCAVNTSQSHTYTYAGPYTVQFIVEDDKGGVATQSVNVDCGGDGIFNGADWWKSLTLQHTSDILDGYYSEISLSNDNNTYIIATRYSHVDNCLSCITDGFIVVQILKSTGQILNTVFLNPIADYPGNPNIVRTGDGYLLSINSYLGDVKVIKLDNNLNVIWAKKYNTTSGDWSGPVHPVIKRTIDGGFVIIGLTNYLDSSEDGFILKADSTGNIIWQKVYGSPGMEDRIDDIVPESNGYVFVGQVDNGNTIIAKVDLQGNILLTKMFYHDYLIYTRKIIKVTDGYLVSIERPGEQVILKLSQDLNEIWVKVVNGLGGINNMYESGNQYLILGTNGYLLMDSNGNIADQLIVRPWTTYNGLHIVDSIFDGENILFLGYYDYNLITGTSLYACNIQNSQTLSIRDGYLIPYTSSSFRVDTIQQPTYANININISYESLQLSEYCPSL